VAIAEERALSTTPLRVLPLAILLMALGACAMPRFLSFPPETRGNRVDPNALAQLVPGTSTRADVSALLGSPTAHASFNDDQWIYISEVTTPVIGGTNAVRGQQVYVMTFDQAGVLRDVEHKSLKDSQPVQVVQRTTPSPGSSASILQQLLGNVGKFSPGGAAESGAQGSAENPGNF
jgi:outer membrane protein assembly factor BamE (lipoprotein component of BamABCDE complex)